MEVRSAGLAKTEGELRLEKARWELGRDHTQQGVVLTRNRVRPPGRVVRIALSAELPLARGVVGRRILAQSNRQVVVADASSPPRKAKVRMRTHQVVGQTLSGSPPRVRDRDIVRQPVEVVGRSSCGRRRTRGGSVCPRSPARLPRRASTMPLEGWRVARASSCARGTPCTQ